MLLRSGYNTEYHRHLWVWSDTEEYCLWAPNEFKSEVREMRKRLVKMGIVRE